MVMLAERVDHVECAHALEAGVRELRLLAAHAPAYNRRSTQPHRGWWVTLSNERFARLRVASTPDGAAEINLANGNAFHVLDALRLSDDNCGSMPIGQLRETLGQPYVRRDLGRLDGRYLERFDTLTAQADTSEGIRMVWG